MSIDDLIEPCKQGAASSLAKTMSFRLKSGDGLINSFKEPDDGGRRIAAGHVYEVNLKSELEILALHQKIDTLREIAGGLGGNATGTNQAAYQVIEERQ